jgi:hypothetical protein
MLKGGSASNGTQLGTLPAACTPPSVKQLVMVTTSNDDIGRVDIQTDGKLILRLGNTTWFNLNMSYIVD